MSHVSYGIHSNKWALLINSGPSIKNLELTVYVCLSHFLVLFYLRPFPDSRKMRDFMALSPCVSTKATQLLVWWSMVHQFFRFFWLHFQGGVIVLVNVVDRSRLTTFTVYNIN